MSVTLLSLIQDVKSRIGETNVTRAAQLDSGVDGTPTVTSDASITAYLNEAANDLARWSYPLVGSASVTVPSGSAKVDYAAMATSEGRAMHSARGVSIAGVPLMQAGVEILRRWLGASFQASGEPGYWFEDGVGIGFDAVVAADTAAVVTGFVLPKPMATGSDTVDAIPDDLARLLVYYAAAMVASKNAEDPSLGPRAAEWVGLYTSGCGEVRARVLVRDPETVGGFFGVRLGKQRK